MVELTLTKGEAFIISFVLSKEAKKSKNKVYREKLERWSQQLFEAAEGEKE